MTRHSYTKTIYGNCSFELIEKYETAEKAAKGQGGQFVEVKLNDVKIEFNKVRREDDGSQKRTPEVKRQGTEEV